jgi:predicted AlkP superfamily phosphohydrolase/phosphomutase/Tfp pilus assembly protein PilF
LLGQRTTIAQYRGLFLLLALWAAAAVGCARDTSSGRTIVLGLDGVDPQIVDLLISEGKLPNFAELRRGGAHGRLISSRPLLSPIIWTTIATGKHPNEHGIAHFVALNEQTGEQLPVTSQMRRVKALWNILSDHDRRVAVVGWWATWPAETVNGAIVSDHTAYHFLFPEGDAGAESPLGVVHPPELQETVERMVRRPESVTKDEVAPFVSVSEEEFARPFDFENDLGHFKWALATAKSYANIGLHLWNAQTPDVLFVYIEAVDSTSHLFGHLFRVQGLAGELAEQQARYGHAVEHMYRFADGIVGDYLAAMDDDTTLMVLSDHGFKLGELHDDPSRARDMRRVSEHFHNIEGILYLYGNHVQRKRLERPTLFDVAPTVLALSGISPAHDMTGRVLEEALTIPRTERTIASYEAAAGREDQPLRNTEVDAAILERLEQLGYLDTVSPTSDRNMAANLFESGRYAESVEVYERLVEKDSDDGAVLASYAGALGALGRYDEALVQLNRAIELDPLNAEAYHNRGLVYEKQGMRDEALADYRTALRYRTDYEPARAALRRVGGNSEPQRAQTANEKLATLLAQRASTAARRGDYDSAMQQLDEAERIAPQLVLVHQYRSNVAFLRGERGAAIAALERALELEPDNALFRTNLERLRETPAN